MKVLVGTILMLAMALGAPPEISALLDGTGDRIVRTSFIPSERNIHGELRLVERGAGSCTQTLLYSKALRRGLQRIRRKELYHWPEGKPGHVDSTAYLEDLDRAGKQILERFAQREDRSDPRQKMLIEFILSGNSAAYAIYEVELSGEPPNVTLEAKHPIVAREASVDYVRRAMDLMLQSVSDEDDVEP